MELLKKRWIYVAAGFAALLFMGVSNAWSIFVVPLEQTYGWLRSDTSMAYTIQVLCFSVESIFAGILTPRLGYSTPLKISSVMLLIGFFLSAIVRQPWQIFITYSVMCGTGIGMGYNCIVSFAPAWFPEKSGTITGLLLFGYALSAAIFSPAINGVIDTAGIAMAFRILSVICFAAVFIGSLFVRLPLAEQLEKLPKAGGTVKKSGRDVNTKQMVKTPLFWLYFVISGFLGAAGLTLLNHASPIMTEELLMSGSAAALIVSVLSISNGAGRVFGGIAYDKIGLKKTLAILACAMAVSVSALYGALLIKNSVFFIAAACCAMILFGVNATTILTIVRELFGSEHFSINYSILSLNTVISATIPSVVGGIRTSSGNYQPAFLMLSGALIATVCLTVVMLRIYAKSEEKEEAAVK